MRIVIEMNEAESRSTTVQRTVAGAAATVDDPAEVPTFDGGPLPEHLRLALGGAEADLAPAPSGEAGVTNAGKAPAWLVDVLTGGAAGAPHP